MGKEEEETGGRAEDERGKGENGSEKRDGGEVEEGKRGRLGVKFCCNALRG